MNKLFLCLTLLVMMTGICFANLIVDEDTPLMMFAAQKQYAQNSATNNNKKAVTKDEQNDSDVDSDVDSDDYGDYEDQEPSNSEDEEYYE
jgi:hypothetical protein